MSRGISINGCAGSGKTTLAKALSEHLGSQHLELDDYYWRKDEALPFTEMNTSDEIISLLAKDISKRAHFVMSGSIGSILWDFVNPLFDFAILLRTPTLVCLERVQARAFDRFDERVCVGGDLHISHQDFYKQIEQYETGENPSYSLQRHKRWLSELCCPTLTLDGTQPIAKNVAYIAEQYLSSQSTR